MNTFLKAATVAAILFSANSSFAHSEVDDKQMSEHLKDEALEHK